VAGNRNGFTRVSTLLKAKSCWAWELSFETDDGRHGAGADASRLFWICGFISFFLKPLSVPYAVCCSLHWAGDSQVCAEAHGRTSESGRRDRDGKGKGESPGATFAVATNYRLGVGRVSSKRKKGRIALFKSKTRHDQPT